MPWKALYDLFIPSMIVLISYYDLPISLPNHSGPLILAYLEFLEKTRHAPTSGFATAAPSAQKTTPYSPSTPHSLLSLNICPTPSSSIRLSSGRVNQYLPTITLFFFFGIHIYWVFFFFSYICLAEHKLYKASNLTCLFTTGFPLPEQDLAKRRHPVNKQMTDEQKGLWEHTQATLNLI